MTESEKNELREALIGQRNAVLDDVNRHGVKTGNGPGVIADETERADVIAENMVEHQLGFSESKLLEKIDYALERLDEGTYGVCDGCKKDINIERLKAKPSVSLCIDCQTAKEQGG
jgi:DnaK suppressor protein